MSIATQTNEIGRQASTIDRAESPSPSTGNAAADRRSWWPIAALGALVVAAAMVIGFAATGSEPASAATRVIEVDVAEDGTRFVWDEAPVYEDGLPKYGNAFVTQGYIYEAGAIAAGAGVNTDGTPTHPDRVLGTWTCEGHFIGEGAITETGPWVISKQVFDFGDVPGEQTIITQGLELADHEVAGLRPIVGGTGPFRSADGVAAQVLHGHNESEGVQLTIQLDVEADSVHQFDLVPADGTGADR